MQETLKKVVVAGGAGFIGKRLVRALLDKGYKVIVLDRVPTHPYDLGQNAHNYEFVKKNLAKESVSPDIVSGAYGVINVAGEGVFQRWNRPARKRILASRSQATNSIVDACLKTMNHPRVVISASAVGMYGDAGDQVVDELSPAGEGFLSEVCRMWEGALAPLQVAQVRIVIMRMSMVLGQGGLLGLLRKFVRMGIAPVLGSGQQFVSWIHIDDLVRMYIEALENEMLRGPINAAAPNPVRQRDFMRTYAQLFGKRILLPTPAFLLKLAWGQRAHLMLDSQRILPRKMVQLGFRYDFQYLEDALKNIEKK